MPGLWRVAITTCGLLCNVVRCCRHGVQPYVVHTTFQNWGNAGKRMRLREAGLWLVDPPAYFSTGVLQTGVFNDSSAIPSGYSLFQQLLEESVQRVLLCSSQGCWAWLPCHECLLLST